MAKSLATDRYGSVAGIVAEIRHMAPFSQEQPFTIGVSRTEMASNYFREHNGKMPVRDGISFMKIHRQ